MSIQIHNVDALTGLAKLSDESVHCVVTSPPYFGLRDYGHEGQIGLEATPQEYAGKLVNVFREVRHKLKLDGTVWLNLGDSYASGGSGWQSKNGQRANRRHTQRRLVEHASSMHKQLLGIPWRVAFALQDDGWYLRQDIIWAKPNPMPESVTDRCTKAHEHLFLLSKSSRYFFDQKAIAEPGSGTNDRPQYRRAIELATAAGLTDEHRAALKASGVSDAGKAQHTQTGYGKNSVHVAKLAAEAKEALGGYTREFLLSPTVNRRSVWTIASHPYKEAHFATFPPALPELCIKAGCPEGGTVLDPFAGAGTTGLVADRLGRDAILFEINPEYAEMARARIHDDAGLFAQVDTP